MLFAASGFGAGKPAMKVTDVRFWSFDDVTRVAIDVSGEFRFEAVRLNTPDRVFFDVQGAKLAGASRKARIIPVKDAFLKQIRLAENSSGATRVVLDLEEGVEYTASQLSNPERLMVELRSRKGAEPKSSSANTPASKTVAALPAPLPAQPKAELAPKGARSVPPSHPTATESDLPIAPSSEAAVQFSALMVPPVFATMTGSSASLSVAANVAPSRNASVTKAVVEIQPSKHSSAKAQTASLPEPKPAARNVNGERSLTRVLGLKLNRIVLDAGHGGHDVGTHGKSGMLEKDLVLDVSKRLAVLLEERMGVEVVLTRSDDTYLSLEERTRLANQTKADLFLSIHANSSPLKSVAGVETFYLNFNAGKDDTDLAMRENAASERSIADLRDVVSKIALRAKLDESREFALRIQSALHTAAAKGNKEAKDRGVKRAPFVVLIGA
ncbi:MAG: N-acetylmuramoyl-L-alanine amidase, partial [Acidobacteriota bacterium]